MEPLTEKELSELADYFPPHAHERIALILDLEGEVVANLLGQHRDNMHSVSLGILRRWKNINHEPGNRVVSNIVISLNWLKRHIFCSHQY